MPPDVRDAWLEGSFRLRLPGGRNRPVESGPARPGACPTAVLTERYYYVFWHPCRSDIATDVIEIDFDAGGPGGVPLHTAAVPGRTPRRHTAAQWKGGSHMTHDQHGLGRQVFCPKCGTGSSTGDSYCRQLWISFGKTSQPIR